MKNLFKEFTGVVPPILLALVFLVGVSFTQAVWVGPTCDPADCNAEAPIHVGEPQTKAGGLVLNMSAYTNALIIPFGNVGIGLPIGTDPTSKLHIAGSLTIADGTQGAGKVLTSDVNGKGSWATSASSGSDQCNSVDTGDYSGRVESYSSKPWMKLSMLINGRNICEDQGGCTYRAWAYGTVADEGAGGSYYGSSPVQFRQVRVTSSTGVITHPWFDSYSSGNSGINGDSSAGSIISNWNSLYIYDDCATAGSCGTGSVIIDTDPDTLVVRDNSSSYKYIVSICDY